jgi:hypothetical protein
MNKMGLNYPIYILGIILITMLSGAARGKETSGEAEGVDYARGKALTEGGGGVFNLRESWARE